ncbi:AAA family ATPase [Pedobacter sp. 22226]|uniref:AAA family ATPase n=1 Tax=Pedobacter sp. 22226 TaxID=3453894 RepID=UPI003F84FBDB
MKITALFILEHEYLNYKAQMINLGGKFFYEIEPISKRGHHISRTPNPKHIDGFYNVGTSHIRIENVSAIVGQNGIGKSSMLDIIRKSFVDKSNGLPYSKYFLILEDDQDIPFFASEDIDNVFFEEEDGFRPLAKLEDRIVQTIYYSPHLDFKYNPNFDEIDYFDISADNYLELDLQRVNEKGKKSNGLAYSVKEELLFKNAVRQIQFLSSPLVTRQKVFQELFDFPDHGEAYLDFRGTEIDKSPRNVPRTFLYPIDQVLDKINKEANAYHTFRKIDKNGNVTNQAEVNGYVLKRDILSLILSIVHRQMDVSNSYLSENEFDEQEFNRNLKTETALDSFYSFFRNAYVFTARGKENPFDIGVIEALVNKLYSIIDQLKDKGSIGDKRIKVAANDAIDLLNLQRDMVFEISDYYNKQLKQHDKDYSNINFLVQGLIYYSPAKKKLSSGENALLNFFSKLYDFLEFKLNVKTNPKPNLQTFVLLLDEADLGFHPVWKKKFVKAIVQTIPHFFDRYPQKPTLQIILTTHDPLSLSDLPSSNVVYLMADETHIYTDDKDIKNTFGANITDLLADSFFLSDGLIGDFAKDKIKEIVNWLNQADNNDGAGHYKKLIEIIDEPIAKRKLAEMYDEKMNSNLQLSVIDQQIKELNQKRNQLTK